MSYLKFTVEADAQAAADEMFFNELKGKADLGPDYVGDGTIDYSKSNVEAYGKANAISTMRVYGRINGKVNRASIGTTSYAIPTKAINDDIWWIAKPEDSTLMENVTGYTEIPDIDPDWVESES